jgi:hypothetical protein
MQSIAAADVQTNKTCDRDHVRHGNSNCEGRAEAGQSTMAAGLHPRFDERHPEADGTARD